jgi:hypothetical protein
MCAIHFANIQRVACVVQKSGIATTVEDRRDMRPPGNAAVSRGLNRFEHVIDCLPMWCSCGLLIRFCCSRGPS